MYDLLEDRHIAEFLFLGDVNNTFFYSDYII